ncbi:MAG: hypothetical protein WB762_12360 [Candidatus Sulfotelmatobacter sp.]
MSARLEDVDILKTFGGLHHLDHAPAMLSVGEPSLSPQIKPDFLSL